MSEIPSYNTWRDALDVWTQFQPTSLHAAAKKLSTLVHENSGVDVSPFTLRYHVEGRYKDVGLEVARAVWKEIQK